MFDFLARKDLNNRASSEIVIRQALTELDIWEVEARFQLVPHRDSRGSSVMLIKDFQDILNKVNLSLFQFCVTQIGSHYI